MPSEENFKWEQEEKQEEKEKRDWVHEIEQLEKELLVEGPYEDQIVITEGESDSFSSVVKEEQTEKGDWENKLENELGTDRLQKNVTFSALSSEKQESKEKEYENINSTKHENQVQYSDDMIQTEETEKTKENQNVKHKLIHELDNFIKERENFPNVLYEYWLTQRGKIEGRKPFLEIFTAETNETWYLPNRRVSWNPGYAYIYSPRAVQNSETTGAGMIIKFFMEEKSAKNTNKYDFQQIRQNIVRELRSQGFEGHKNPNKWFQAVYKLKYDENQIDKAIAEIFKHEYGKNDHWKLATQIDKYPVFKKVLRHYEKEEILKQNRNEKEIYKDSKKQDPKLIQFKKDILPKIVSGLKKEGLQFSDSFVLNQIQETRKSREIGFIGRNGVWKVEIDWKGREAVDGYFKSLTKPISGFKIWMEYLFDKGFYREGGKRIFYTVETKKIPELKGLNVHGDKLMIFNTKNRFGTEIGIDRAVLSKKRYQSIRGFKNSFLEKIELPSGLRNEVEEKIVNEFHNKYGRVFDNYLNGRARRDIYTLKYSYNDLESSLIRRFSYWKHSNLYQFEKKNTQEVINYFDEFSYAQALSGEPIDYAITISQVSHDGLKELYNDDNTKSIDDILNALEDPRKTSAVFTQTYFGTKDVKPPLIVNMKDGDYYKNESKPDGQVAIIQALFQDHVFTEMVNNYSNIKLPQNGIYEFKGQSRGKSSTSTVYEDVSSVKDNLGEKLNHNVNLLIKNSTERNKKRIIEDYIKSLNAPSDQSIFILVAITHPDDLDLEHPKIPDAAVKGISDYQEGRRIGWIDIGISKGEDRLRNVSQIYGAVKYVRKSWKKEKDSEKVIHEALKKLDLHQVKDVDIDNVRKMNSLFDLHNIWSNPRNLNYRNFEKFVGDLVVNFLLEDTDAEI